jgi:alkylation response protein AidB-like acyl-CoA dehydrogenase
MATAAVGVSLLEAVKEIAPIIRENAARSERDRRLADETVDAMKRAGLFRMAEPQSLGGMEVDAITAMRVWEEVSRIDVSAGWNLIIASGGIVFGSWIPEQGVQEVLAGDPDSILAGAVFPPGKAVPADGGYRVSGRWPFASGCQHASYFVETAHIYDGEKPRLDENGRPIQLLFVLPAAQAEILDTWHTMGMCATGSHDIAINDLFVPGHRVGVVAPLEKLPKMFDAPLYRMTVWLPVASLAAPALGVARAAIDSLVELGSQKTPAYSGSPLAGGPAAQAQLGAAEAMLGAARAYIYEALEAAWRTAMQGQFLSMPQKIAIQLAASHAIRSSAKVVELVHQAAGTSAIRREQPFERYFRDVHVITQHAFGSASRFESVGKLLFGKETDWPFFAM